MTYLYRIRDWRKHFEKNRTHGKTPPKRVSIPNNLDGSAYAELVQEHTEGPAHFGAWIVLLQTASKCNPRGTLVRSNGLPHDTLSLSRVTRFPERILNDALLRLVSLGWIEVSEVDGNVPVHARDGLSPCAQVGQAGAIGGISNKDFLFREDIHSRKEIPESAFMQFPCLDQETFTLDEAKAKQWEGTFLAVDVRSELRMAWQWLEDHPRNRKTVDGMPRFLSGWLKRAQNSAPRVTAAGPAPSQFKSGLRGRNGQ
jgi:hypothetical protein